MKNDFNGHGTIYAFVDYKIRNFEASERSFASLFEFAFSERENIMYEESQGFRYIKKTYGEVRTTILKTASIFKKITADIPEDSVIGLYMNNSLEWIIAFWTILICGFRPLLLNNRLSDEIISSVVKSMDVKLVVSDGKCFARTLQFGELAAEVSENDNFARGELAGEASENENFARGELAAEVSENENFARGELAAEASENENFARGELAGEASENENSARGELAAEASEDEKSTKTVAGENAGNAAGENAGNVAGENAGTVAGENAGNVAGENAGTAAGENAGTAATAATENAMKAPAGEFQIGRCGSDLMVMSSGTSDALKICAYSPEEFFSTIRDSYHLIHVCHRVGRHYNGKLKLLLLLPLCHIFGLVAVYIWFSFFSRTFVGIKSLDPTTLVNTIKRHGVTHILAVPLFWEKVYDQAIEGIKDRGPEMYGKFQKGMAISDKIKGIPGLSTLFSHIAYMEVRKNLFGKSIRFLISGGSLLPDNVLFFFNSIGYTLAVGYGMTEVGITSVNVSDRQKTLDTGSIGTPFTSLEYSINEGGELLIRGSSTARTILEIRGIHSTEGPQPPVEIYKNTEGRWYNTHDLAEKRNGLYFILGRKDDVIIDSGGENVNPNLIEPMLKCGGMERLCLTAVNFAGAKRMILVISVKEGTTEEGLKAIKEQLKEKLAQAGIEKNVAKIIYTEDPLMGENDIKVSRSGVAKRIMSGDIKPFGEKREHRADVPKSDILEHLVEKTKKQLHLPEVDIDADFFTELGGTSLDYFALWVEIEECYSVPFPINDGFGLNTLRVIYEFILAQRK